MFLPAFFAGVLPNGPGSAIHLAMLPLLALAAGFLRTVRPQPKGAT